MAALNLMGYTKEEWATLSRKQKRQAKFKTFKQNVLPAFLGGAIGVAILAKDKRFRKVAQGIVLIGVTGGLAGIGAGGVAAGTAGTDIFKLLKEKGANLLNFKNKLTNDQKNGLRILGEQTDVKSKLSFTGEGKAKIDTENSQDYEVEYDGWGQITNEIAEAKGIPEDSAAEIAQIVASQPASKQPQVKAFLKRLWEGVWTNIPQIIATMQNSGLDLPDTNEIEDDNWDGTANLPEGSPPPTDPNEEKKIFGIPQTTFLGGTALVAIGYAVIKK